MRSSLGAVLLLAGCAGTPDDSLLWSDELVRTLPRESGEAVEVARFSRLAPSTSGRAVATLVRAPRERSNRLPDRRGRSGRRCARCFGPKRARARVARIPRRGREARYPGGAGRDGDPQRIGQWVNTRRNVVEDYRRAFGEEAGDIVAVGSMTDPGDDNSRRRGYYGDITLRRQQ